MAQTMEARVRRRRERKTRVTRVQSDSVLSHSNQVYAWHTLVGPIRAFKLQLGMSYALFFLEKADMYKVQLNHRSYLVIALCLLCDGRGGVVHRNP